MKEVALGIDVGGTNTKFGFADKSGNIYGENSCETRGYPVFDDYLKHLHLEIEEAREALDFDVDIKGIGIGAPNGNIYDGTIKDAPNLEWKETVHIVEKLQAYYQGIPIILTNDANAAAIGETTFGAAKGM